MLSGREKPLLLLSQWVNVVVTWRWHINVFVIVSAIACLFYTVNNLGMNTDTQDMLSSDLDWRQSDMEMDRLFPQYTDNILVVVEARTPDEAGDAARLLTERLQTENQFFKSVYFPAGLDFFRQSSLLFLDNGELQDLADNLAAIQPFLGRLTNDQSLHGLFGMLDEAINARLEGEDIDIEPLLKRLDRAINAVLKDRHHRLSWRALMSGHATDKPVYREFILLQPRLDFAGLFPATAAIANINAEGRKLGLTEDNGINLRLTGSAVLSHEELQSVSIGMGRSVIIAFILVAIILVIGLASIWLVAATLITLLAGLIFTAAFATLTVGTLNLISVAFAILYIGLGVDFAIHYCLRYREQMSNVDNKKAALQATAVSVGESLLLCAITTAIGFYAFMPTDYNGVAELGWIAGSGMFISFIITMTLLPALLACMPGRFKKPDHKSSSLLMKLADVPRYYHRQVIWCTVIVVVVSLLLIPGIRFDHNILNLQSPDNPSVQAYQDLLDDSDTSPWTGQVLANSRKQAQQLDAAISRLDVVDKVVWIEDFIPEEQQEKLSIITEIELLLGIPGYGLYTGSGENDNDPVATIRQFNRSLREYIDANPGSGIGEKLHATIRSWLVKLQSQPASKQQVMLTQLENTLLGTFPGRLAELEDSLSARSVSLETIPGILKSRWQQDGHYRLEIYPVDNLTDNAALRHFVDQVRTVAPDLVGAPVINLEAGDAVVSAFREAFSYAFVAIIVLLLLLTRNKRDVFYIITPLLLAILFTGAISVLLSIPLNFANVIALPMLLGIGVDSAIHILHRARTNPPGNGVLLSTSSARAVIVSALTTIFSIGNLAFSRHLGTASMGQLLVIGISMTLLCTLLILPSLLAGTIKTKNNAKQ